MKLTKIFIVIIFILAVLFSAKKITAESITPTTSPLPTEKAKMIDDLKNRLATKVAELRQTEKKAIFGTVKSVSPASITVELKQKEVKIDLPDDLKVIQILNGKRTTLTNDDIDKGDLVTVFGDYDATLDLLKAKIVFIQGAPTTVLQGKVTDINKTDFSFTLTTENNQTITIDIESYTKTFQWIKDKGQISSGFSKMNVGDIVHVMGKPVAKKDNRYHALRILDLGNPLGTPIITPTTSATPSATPKTTAAPTDIPKPS